MNNKIRHSVIPRTLCFIFHKGKALLIKYSEKKWDMAWYYNWVWWHIEEWEWIIQSAQREILEETWLKVDARIAWIVHATNFYWKNIMLYITVSKATSDKFVEDDEWTLHWIEPSELDNYKVFEDFSILMNKVVTINDWEIFTAKSLFDWKSWMLEFNIE